MTKEIQKSHEMTLKILKEISKHNSISLYRLCLNTKITKPTLKKHLKFLEILKLIKVEDTNKNRILIYEISISKKGRELIKNIK